MLPVEVSSDYTGPWYSTAPTLVLDWFYDPNQHWLPFREHYFAFQAWPKKAEEYIPAKPKSFAPKPMQPVEPDPPHGQMNFEHPSFLKQYLLPFRRNYLRVTNSQLKHYKFLLRTMRREAEEAGVPLDASALSWELNRHGKFHIVDVRTGETNEEVSDWCSQTLRRRYNLSGRVLTLESAHDAMMAKLRFR